MYQNENYWYRSPLTLKRKLIYGLIKAAVIIPAHSPYKLEEHTFKRGLIQITSCSYMLYPLIIIVLLQYVAYLVVSHTADKSIKSHHTVTVVILVLLSV